MTFNDRERWDVAYEWKIVALLSIGFGLVGVDRFMIMPLFPTIMKDLRLDYQDLGQISGALSVAWGLSAICMGNMADRIGHRKVIISSLIIFSLLAGLSGVAGGVGSLLLIRAMMGVAEGAFTPASIVATLNASKPERHGRNVGIQQMALPLFGLGVAPIIVTQMLKVVSWHWIFAIVSIPGLIVAFLTYRVLRDPRAASAALHTSTHDTSEHRWFDVFRYRNVPLNMAGMLCWLTCLVVLSALFPNYLTDYLHLSLEKMGFVLSAIGFGGTFGTLLMPGLSDRLGRKPVMIMSVVGAFVFLALLTNADANPVKLFTYLLLTLVFLFALIAVTAGPLSAEAVPARLMSTASGLVIGVGEVFGGGVAPVLGGYVAKHYGIQYIMYLALGALVLGMLVTISLVETAPVRLKKVTSAAPMVN